MKKTSLALIIIIALLLGKDFLIKSPSKEDNALDVIMTRSSVRKYTDMKVSDEKIDKLLRAGMAAPTAYNRQPWEFIAITNRAVLDSLVDTSPHSKNLETATLAILVCVNIEKASVGANADYWIQDCSAASQNILLAAHAMKLGAVWQGVFPVEKQVASVQDVLDLPKHIVPLNIIAIGYPNAPIHIKDKFKVENIKYIK